MVRSAARPTFQERVTEAILEAAARLFADGGTASMGDVANAAGMARATLYRYFPNRGALLDDLARWALADTGDRLTTARLDHVNVGEGISRAVRAFITVGEAFVVLVRERPDAAGFERQVTDPLRSLIERGQTEGLVRDDVPAAWLAESLIGLVATVVLSRHPLGVEDTVVAIASLFLDGARAR